MGTIITLPSSVRIRHIEWEFDQPAQVNRGAYSGARQVVSNPWHGIRRGTVQLAPLIGEAAMRPWRAFLASLLGTVNTFLLPATEAAQHAAGNSSVSGSAAQGAASLTLAVPPELITNGTFTTNTSGWTAGLGAGLSVVSGRLRITLTAAGAAFAYQAIPTITGKTYQLSLDCVVGATSGQLNIGTSIGAADICTSGFGATVSGFTVTFTAQAALTYINLWNPGATVGLNVDFDNVSVKESPGTATPALRAGMFATVQLPSGNFQMVTLTADIATSTIAFRPALREAVSAGAHVETMNPSCQVALAQSSYRYSVDPGGPIYTIGFDVEEAF